MGDRASLRTTFNDAASSYHQARTRYPDALFDSLLHHTGAGPGSRVLEIGPATGIATESLARRGLSVTGLELGSELAAAATDNLAAYQDVEVIHGSFDAWDPPEWGAFDLVVAASAWHWLDPTTRYGRAHRHLRPGGHLAFWSAAHVIPLGGDPFFAEIQDVYDEIGEGMPDGWVETRPGEIPDSSENISASGRFDVVAVEQYDWELVYDAEGYLALLDTFSGHIAMTDAQRDRLYGEIRDRLADRPDGRLRRHYGAVLHVARRTD